MRVQRQRLKKLEGKVKDLENHKKKRWFERFNQKNFKFIEKLYYFFFTEKWLFILVLSTIYFFYFAFFYYFYINWNHHTSFLMNPAL